MLNDVLDPIDRVSAEWVLGQFEPGSPTLRSATTEGPLVIRHLWVGPSCSGLPRGSLVQLRHHPGVWELETKPLRQRLKARELASGRRITVRIDELISEYSGTHPVLTTGGKGSPASANPA